MQRWDKMIQKKNNTINHRDFIEPTVECMRKKGKKRQKIQASEILSIAYRVLIEKEFQTNVARAYRISSSRVSGILKKIMNNPGTL